MSGTQARNIALRAPERAARHLSLHPGSDEAGTWDGLPRHRHLVRVYLDAMLPLVEGLCWCLHRPTNYSWKIMVQSLLTDVVPSHRTV
jgi:hypothetical protein